jgi:ADP-ribose pyrophosphatase
MAPPEKHGPWQILSRREVYRDPWIHVTRDEVIRPDGAPGSHCIVRLKAGVTVLAVDEADNAYLTEEFHYAVGRETLEAVSGGIDEGETPEVAARRELQEELGITASEWIDLGACDPITSVVTSPTRLFLARGLTFGPGAPEGTELISCRKLPLPEAIEMVLDGRISHAPSGLVILKARIRLGN